MTDKKPEKPASKSKGPKTVKVTYTGNKPVGAMGLRWEPGQARDVKAYVAERKFQDKANWKLG